MHHCHLDLQSAADHVEFLLRQALHRFERARADLTSFLGSTTTQDAKTHLQVQTYVSGLEDWMVGSTQWSFESERYFGKNRGEVLSEGVVQLIRLCN